MKNIFRHLTKTHLLLAGLLLCALFAFLRPVDVKADTKIHGSVNSEDLVANENYFLDGDLIININADKTITSISCFGTVEYTLTITGDERHRLRAASIKDSFMSLIMHSGIIEVNGSNMLLVKDFSMDGGTIAANTTSSYGLYGNHDAVISGGSINVTAAGSGITFDDLTITGGNISAVGRDAGIYAHKLTVSGDNTEVYAKTDAGKAIESATDITINRPLEVTTPNGGGISSNGNYSFIATVAGGDTPALEVRIKKPSGGGGGTGGGNTGGGCSSSRSDDDDDKEEDRTDSKPVVVNKDVLFVSNMTGLPYGTFFVKQEQGVAAKYAFAAALQKGYKSAFTFNMITNGKKPEFTLKKGTFTLTIPPELRKAGRTFAIRALDKNGKVFILPDKDKNPDTITVDVNLEGYAFELIYKDSLFGSDQSNT